MTTKPKAQDAEAQTEQPAKAQTPTCGAPHYLPLLAHVTCQLDAEPDLKPGDPGHEHRHQDGDALYLWQ